MLIKEFEDYIEITGVDDFSSKHTFLCGQCFRFDEQKDGSFIGVAFDKVVKICDIEDGLRISGTRAEFNKTWKNFLDLERDYASIRKSFATDEFTKNAAEFGRGIRLLQQDHWEALCSFIISQCNNIPRIRSIVRTLCKNFGQKIEFEGQDYFTFPSPQKIASLTLEDLAILKCGYRAPYILEAAKSIVNGTLDFEMLSQMDTPTARKSIMTQKGVGAKVADCFLLFGLYKYDAFPKDTWMKKAKEFYDGEMDETAYGKYAGIYQQYIFYYARENGIGTKPKK